MSLYHEAASILLATQSDGGSLKSQVFGRTDLKSPAAQVYALALETCKWSAVLKEVIEYSQLLQLERKLTPELSLLLVHDLLVSKTGIALPQSHGLRAAVERHKARLTAELTRARLRRKMATLEALQDLVEADATASDSHPRWVRINTLKSTLDEQLDSTFAHCQRVLSVAEVATTVSAEPIFVDAHVPNLVAVAPRTDLIKTAAYRSGAIILQDKASCFPAYMLDPSGEDGDLIDACAAPGNKTTHLAAILASRTPEGFPQSQRIYAFERDAKRAQVLEAMVQRAGAERLCKIHPGQDFLKVDPDSPEYSKVGALLLDPSCSGSGIVGRDVTPQLFLPEAAGKPTTTPQANGKGGGQSAGQKRKREGDPADHRAAVEATIVDDDGKETTVSSGKELKDRLAALASFQLSLLLHAFKFPAARKITYSTCSVHSEENEQVAIQALQSEVAVARGWKILERGRQVRGMQEWPVRGAVGACQGDEMLADACIRAYKDDGRGVMGFFVAGFVRDGSPAAALDEDGPYLRDEDGRIIRDELGLPTLKNGTRLAYRQDTEDEDDDDEEGHAVASFDDNEGPYLRDEQGRIIRAAEGMPTLKPSLARQGRSATAGEDDEDVEDDDDYDSSADESSAANNSEWGGFND